MCKGHFIPPSASLGVFGHVGDSCGFLSRRNCPPPESDSLGSFRYLPVRWRAILFPNESAKAISSRQVLVWRFWVFSGLVLIRVATELSATRDRYFLQLCLPPGPMA